MEKEVAARVAEEVKRLEESCEECVAERVSEEMKRREGGRVEGQRTVSSGRHACTAGRGEK